MKILLQIWFGLVIILLVSLIFESIYNLQLTIPAIGRIIGYSILLGLTFISIDHMKENREDRKVKKVEDIFKEHLSRKDKEIEALQEEKNLLLSAAIKHSESQITRLEETAKALKSSNQNSMDKEV